MTPIRLRSFPGFTVIEVCVIVFIIAVLVAVLYPVYSSRSHGHPKQNVCLSNEKQIGLALLSYAQDYDDTFPPVSGQFTASDGTKYERQWGPDTSVIIKDKYEVISGLISPYYVIAGFLECPSSQSNKAGLSYIYSDLTAGEPLKNFTAPAHTVAFTDSEDRPRNIGHARSQSKEGDAAVLHLNAPDKGPKLLLGVAVGDAAMRHSGGANYGFADGHVKWMKPEYVFFPPRTSNSSHREAKTGRLLGPDPAGTTQAARTFQGKVYKATFHLR